MAREMIRYSPRFSRSMNVREIEMIPENIVEGPATQCEEWAELFA